MFNRGTLLQLQRSGVVPEAESDEESSGDEAGSDSDHSDGEGAGAGGRKLHTRQKEALRRREEQAVLAREVSQSVSE